MLRSFSEIAIISYSYCNINSINNSQKVRVALIMNALVINSLIKEGNLLFASSFSDHFLHENK